MDIRQPGFTRFSRFGANLGRLHVTAAQHAEALDGTDELTITCQEDLAKNDYVVWLDRRGVWHEHIVDSAKRGHDDSGEPLTVAVCMNSIAETWDDYVEDKRPSGNVATALASILATSRWDVGTCTQPGTASHTFYHISVREAIAELLETWGGELETAIECDGDKVTGRTACIRSMRGDQASAKRFTWSKDLVSVTRSVEGDNPKSRIYAYGKGVETESGGFGRRLTIEEVNNGLAYVEDAEATLLWGHPDGKGGIAPAVGTYLNETCEDAAQLLNEARDYLKAAKEPTVTYTAKVIDLVSFGRDWEDVALGDRVTIIDKGFSDEGLRLQGRISKLERDLFTYDTTVTFGNLVDAIASPLQSMQSKVAALSKRSVDWDMAGDASPGWLNNLVTRMNAAYNQAGTYHYSSFEKGEIWASVPLDENGRATRPGGWAMNINGMGFRLASSLKANGDWNWRTFGNGKGFVADEITAGIIRGGSSYWNLATGALVLTGGSIKSSTIEGSTLRITTASGARLVISADGAYITIEDGDKRVRVDSERIRLADASSGSKILISRFGIDIDSGTENLPGWTSPGRLSIDSTPGVFPQLDSPIKAYAPGSVLGTAIFGRNLNHLSFEGIGGNARVEFSTAVGTYAVTAWLSDRRDKEQIEDSETDATALLRRIRHRSFRWRDVTDERGVLHEGAAVGCGYVAQEMAEINPAFVFTVGEHENGGRLQIAEDAVIPVLSKAMQEMDARISALEQEIAELKEGR